MALTSIITVNYNQTKTTIEFLNSIKAHRGNERIEVILVDNGCKQSNEAIFKKAYAEVKYIPSEQNLGFAGGNNLGIMSAQGDFLLFLNNDTEISSNFIGTLINEFNQNPEIGILSPLIIYNEDKNRIQYAGFSKMNYCTGRNKGIGNLELDKNQYQHKSQETGYIHGAAMMCRKSDLERTGLMDESYFLYYEEIDWCEKFKKVGMKVWFTGKAKIFHKESISVGKDSSLKTYFMIRNRMLFIRKNTSLFNTIVFSAYYLGIACPKTMVQYYINGRKDLIPWVIKAIAWNLTHSKNSRLLGYKSLN